jgi:hypothetical protein
MREILLHLNAQLPDDDPRTVEQIEQGVKNALEVGSDDPSLAGIDLEVAMAEEI